MSLSAKQSKRYAAILITAVLSTGSTSGYLVMLLIFLGYLAGGVKNGDGGISSTILKIGLLVSIAIVIDFILRGDFSVLQSVVIDKLFGSSASFDLSGSTGANRLSAITIGAQTMIEHPFGVGYSQWSLIRSNAAVAMGGGGWFALGAAEGIGSFLLIAVWAYVPILLGKGSNWGKVALIAFMLYCGATQTYGLYPIYASLATLYVHGNTLLLPCGSRGKGRL